MVLRAYCIGSHLTVLFMSNQPYCALVDGIRSSPFIFSGYSSLGENCFWKYNVQKPASKYAESVQPSLVACLCINDT